MNKEELKKLINKELQSIIALLTLLPPDHEFCQLVKEFAESDGASDMNTIFDAWTGENNQLKTRLTKVADAAFETLQGLIDDTKNEKGDVEGFIEMIMIPEE